MIIKQYKGTKSSQHNTKQYLIMVYYIIKLESRVFQNIWDTLTFEGFGIALFSPRHISCFFFCPPSYCSSTLIIIRLIISNIRVSLISLSFIIIHILLFAGEADVSVRSALHSPPLINQSINIFGHKEVYCSNKIVHIPEETRHSVQFSNSNCQCKSSMKLMSRTVYSLHKNYCH
jgi:hypothetical protein